MANTKKKQVYCLVRGTEDTKVSDINLANELDESNCLFFDSVNAILEYQNDEEDFSDCKIFVFEVVETGAIKSTSKFVKDS